MVFKNFSSYSKKHDWKKFFLCIILGNFSFVFKYFNYENTRDLITWFILFFTMYILQFTIYFIIAFFIYKNSFFNSIIAILITIFISILIEICVSKITYYIFLKLNALKSFQELFHNFILTLIFIIIQWNLIMFFRRHPFHLVDKRKGLLIIFLIIQLVVFFFIILPIFGILIPNIPQEQKSFLVTSIMLFIFFGNIIFILITLKSLQKAQLELQLNILYDEMQRELDYYKSINTNLIHIRKIRHDFNNQLQTAYALLEDDPCKLAASTNKNFDSHLDSLAIFHFCDNVILNFIIQNASLRTEQLNIMFQVNIDVPDSIGIEKIDLCSIFSNLLNNAIHAAQKTKFPSIS